MYCPTCREVQLLMTDRQGIEIDYCPQCRGVWLDRGELDKLIDRATLNNQNPATGTTVPLTPTGAQPQTPAYPVQPPPGQQPYQQPYNQHQQHQQPYNQHQQPYNQQQQHYDQQYYNKHGHYPKRKKRESFLDDLFDFD